MQKSVYPLNTQAVEQWKSAAQKDFSLADFVSTMQSPIVVVKFSGANCGPCHTIAPFFEQLATGSKPIFTCFDCDANEMNALATSAGIRSLPTFQFYTTKLSSNGSLEKLDEIVGADSSALKNSFIKVASFVQSKAQKQQPQQNGPMQQQSPQQQQSSPMQQAPQHVVQNGQNLQQQVQQGQFRNTAPMGLPPPPSAVYQQNLPSSVNVQPYNTTTAQPHIAAPGQMQGQGQPQNGNTKSELIQIRQELMGLLNRLNNAINTLP
jgi:thioredoxin 1